MITAEQWNTPFIETLRDLPESTVGYDIDEVLCMFVEGFVEYATARVPGFHYEPNGKWFHLTGDLWKEIEGNREFWLGLKPYPDIVGKINHKPRAYVTARGVANTFSEEWLRINGFPCPERVVTVNSGSEKLAVIKELGITHFIDDKLETVIELRNAGINAYLMARPHNEACPEDILPYRVECVSGMSFNFPTPDELKDWDNPWQN